MVTPIWPPLASFMHSRWKHDGTYLETRWYLSKATFVYKVLNNSAAPTLKDSFLSRSILVNNYNLRNSQTDLALSKPKREFLKKSFKYGWAYMWNNLPLEAKQAQSIFTFKNKTKSNVSSHVSNKIIDVNSQVISSQF